MVSDCHPGNSPQFATNCDRQGCKAVMPDRFPLPNINGLETPPALSPSRVCQEKTKKLVPPVINTGLRPSSSSTQHTDTHNNQRQQKKKSLRTHAFAQLSSLFVIHTTLAHTPTTNQHQHLPQTNLYATQSTCPISVRHLSPALIRSTRVLANLLTGYL